MYKLTWTMKSVNKSIALIHYISVLVPHITTENNEMMTDSALLTITIRSMKTFPSCFRYGAADRRFSLLNPRS